MKVDREWVSGRVNYGHYEGNLRDVLTEEEIKDFKALLKKDSLSFEEEDRFDEYEETILDAFEFVLDDYDIEWQGPLDWSTVTFGEDE